MKLFGNNHHGGSHVQGHGETREPEIQTTEIRSDAGALSGTTAAPDAAAAQKKKKRRKVFIILGVIVLVLLAAVAAYAIWERPPEIIPPAPTPTPAQPQQADSAQQSGGNGGAKGTPGADATPGATEPPVEEDYSDAPTVPVTSKRKDGVYTFLLAGVDYASNSTDTIMLVSFDTAAHTISCTSIPRDTLINISWATTPKKINTVYPGYINSGKDGVEGLKTHIKNLLGFDVDCYVIVSLKAVEDAVDAIGGVWYDVPRDLRYSAPDQGLYIDIKAGYQKLDGENALKLCRFRADYAGGDLDRIGVQQDFLKAMASQIISVGSIPHMGDLIDVLLEDVDTDLSAANLAWLARQFLACKSEDITFQTAPLSESSGINDVSFVGLDVNAWLKMVNDSISPFVDDITVSNVNILTFNYNGAWIGSTTGSIAGGDGSFYCQSCTIHNGGSVIYHAPGAHYVYQAYDAPAGDG